MKRAKRRQANRHAKDQTASTELGAVELVAKDESISSLRAVERDARGRVLRGALNPGGRPKEEREVIEALRLRGLELAEKLIWLGLKGNVKAIEVAFNRAYGKPREIVQLAAVGVGAEYDLSKLETDELRTLVELLNKATPASEATKEPADAPPAAH